MAQVVVAVRGGLDAKTRCAESLDGPDRARLTAAMLEDMLAAVVRCEEAAATWVVTPTPELAELAGRCGARAILQDDRQNGLNAAFGQALALVGEQAPYDSVVLMPGDLPLLEPDDLGAAIRLLRTHGVVLAPSLDGGTGLVGMRAGAPLEPAFGPDSFRRHAAEARRAGLSIAVVVAGSLSHDVDRPDDLAHLLEHGPSTRAAAFLRQRLRPQIRS
jgi:2-phospho-L-lactate/phosphoenolpyruvate guanylyltransferase